MILPLLRWVALTLTLATTGCQIYSRVTTPPLRHPADTPAGQRIADTREARSLTPEQQIGGFLDAAALAVQSLQANPEDVAARADYNFAVARAVEVVSQWNLEPWKAPIRCPGAQGEWLFTYDATDHPDHDPALFSIRPADRYHFRGRLVSDRTLKDGLGAPLVVTSRGFDPTTIDPFAQGRYIYYGLTAVVHFNGRQCRTSLLDPLATEDVSFKGRSWPLAADFTAPIGLALAELNPRRVELKRMFRPEEFKASTRLARLQPFDPSKIPVLFIHGLGDSQATWAPMIEGLRGDETIRRHYQVWFFSYPTGYPYPMMAALLRDQLDAIQARYPNQKRLIVVGHSMGGMIARVLITDSGLDLWKAYFPTPPERTPLSPETLQMMKDALIFESRPEIARVIYLSASLRGSDLATNFIGRLGNRLIGEPADLSEIGQEALRLALPSEEGQRITRMPNSVDALDPNNRFLRVINELPTRKGVPYHSIIADRGRGGNKDRTPPVSSDGIVPFWSSHVPTAQSELIVPSNHWSNRHPLAIAEVRRILVEHLQK
ncbi:MAG: esterase/lipase family protein [Verrucomicrobiales bacterium]